MGQSPPPIVDKSGNGKVWWIPSVNAPATTIFPAAGLTPQGVWWPLAVDAGGNLIVSSMGSGTPHYDDAQEMVQSGEPQTLIDETVPTGLTRYLSQVMVVTRVAGSYVVMAGSEVIGSGRTGPACDGRMTFNPSRPIAAGTEYQVIFTSRLNAPEQSVECYVQASDLASS